MSDLCMNELEDIVWDEICQSDDHIVPQPREGQGNENTFPGNSSKKPRHEVIDFSSNAGNICAATYISEGKEEGHFPNMKNRRDTMLDKDSWAHTSECAFRASCDSDSIKEATSLVSDNSRMSSHSFKSSNIDSIGSEFHADDRIIGERCGVVNDNSYGYSLDHISQTDNDLSFIDNECEDKESTDILYYGWPNIENFEDVDRMFRSCDSTFGLAGLGNEDELGWFSPSHTIEGSEDALESDFKFSFESSPSKVIHQQHEPSKLNNACSSINGSAMENASVNYKFSSRTSEDDDLASVGHLSFATMSDTISERKDECMPNEQINLQKEQAKHHYQSEGKRKGRCLGSGGLYHHSTNLRFKDMNLPSANSSRQVSLPPQMQNAGPDSFGCLQTHTPYIHSDCNQSSDQISVSPTPSGIKSENKGLTSLSTKESSYASNQMQSMERSHGHSFEAQQGFQQSFTSNQKHDMEVQTASKLVSVPKRVNRSKTELENRREVEAVILGVPAELHSSNVQESSGVSSGVSSGLDEISFEATSFRQLQRVMEQLDIRTKLCIRDSLYRLARSAEKRHHNANLNSGSRDDIETSGALMDGGTTKCSGLMDIETDTNPIDRSIAHLLFHRPSDSSVLPAYDPLSIKSHTMIHGSITCPPVMAEKLVCPEETAAEANKRVLNTEDK